MTKGKAKCNNDRFTPTPKVIAETYYKKISVILLRTIFTTSKY